MTEQGSAAAPSIPLGQKAFSGPVLPFGSRAARVHGAVQRATFRAPSAQRELERLGYAEVPFLDVAAMQALRGAFDAVGPAPDDPRDGFFPGNSSRSRSWKAAVIDAVRPIVDERLADTFDDYHAFHLTFLVKWPGPAGYLQAHQDPTMVDDEQYHRGVTLWCPVPSEAELSGGGLSTLQGMLRVLPGSHRLESGRWYRGRGAVESAVAPVEGEIYERFGREVPVAPGNAIVFDHRLVHYSFPNATERPRLALAIALRPREAHNVHIERTEDGWVDVYRVDDEYFVEDPNVGELRYERVERLRSQPFPGITTRELEELERSLLDDDSAAEAGAGADDAVPNRLAAARDFLVAVRPGWRRPRAGALTDAALDRRLGRDGFVKLELLAPAEAGALRDRFGEMHGWEGSGFRTDSWHDDGEYRERAVSAIAEATDPAIDRVFRDHHAVIRNFVVKWPQPEEDGLFPQAHHRDWMVTDERDGERSWVVWVALEDIDGDNGQLRVARGSHRLDRMLRGIDLEAEWRLHGDVWEERLLSVPLRRGEAVVMDSALVHCSFRNLTDRPRVAIGIVVTCRQAQVVYFQRRDERWGDRYEVPPDFFDGRRMDRLGAEPPPGVTPRRVPIEATTLSAGALARRLDFQPLAMLDRVRHRNSNP